MIKGALILAVGFSLGYAKALHDQDDIREGLAALRDALKEHESTQPTHETVDGTVTEETPDNVKQGEQADE